MAAGGAKKGKGGKGGKKGGKTPASRTMAVGSILQPASSFQLWKVDIPPVHRSAPALLHRRPPAPPLQTAPDRLPIAVVRAAIADNAEAVLRFKLSGGSMDATWDHPDGNLRGNTLLMLASVRGLVELVEMLLNNEATLDVQNSAGSTALMLAVGSDRRAVVQKLLRAGARTDLRMRTAPHASEPGPSALQMAVKKGYLLIADMIRTHDTLTAGRPVLELPEAVAQAAIAGEVDAVCLWLKVGAPVDTPWRTGNGGHSLLLLAAEHGHAHLVDALLERQASTYFKGPDGSTPMMTAAFRSHAHVTRRLLLHQLKHREAPAFTSEKDLTDLQKARDEAPPIPEWSMEFRARTERSPRQPLALRPPPQLAPQLAQRGAPQL